MPPQAGALAPALSGQPVQPQQPAQPQLTIRDVITQTADRLGIPSGLALAIVQQESSGNQAAISPKGARGMFQLMPGTAADLGVNPDDPFENIVGGLRYFKQQLDGHKGDVRLALAAYNAGPGRTAAGMVPDIPETQDYVMRVIQRWQQGETPTAQSPVAATAAQPAQPAQPPPALPAATTHGMLPQSTPTTTSETPYQTPAERERALTASTFTDLAGGARAQLARTVFGGGDVIRRTLGMDRVIDRPTVQAVMTPPASGAGTAGQFLTEAAEFATPAGLVTKGRKALQITQKLINAGISPQRARLVSAAIEGGAQGLTAGGVTALHGDDPTAAAVLSVATPIASQMVISMAPAIRKAAITRMARFMERGVQGDLTPEMEKQLASAAADFIDLPLQRTWRQTAHMTRGRRAAARESLESALAGPLGDTPVPKGPVIKALDDLAQDAQHLVPVQGGVRTATYQPGLPSAVEDLKSLLDQYDDLIPARQLHDIKSTWWETVYPRREAAKPISSIYELLTTAQKKAHLRGAAAIADVLKTDAPQVAALDSALTHAIKLDQFVKRLAVRARTGTLARPEAKYAIGAVGGAVGMGAGGALGHPFIGAHLGYATARMLLNAIESPKWRLLPIAKRRQLADALASGNAKRVQEIALPLALAATADQDNLLSPGNVDSSASAAR